MRDLPKRKHNLIWKKEMLLTYMRPLRRTSAWSALGVGRVRGGEEGEGRGRGREGERGPYSLRRG